MTLATMEVAGTHAADAGARCLFCGSLLHHTFVDLGMSPLCESYVSADGLNRMEPFYPLHARVCSECWLVQLQEYVSPADIFSDYAYFSSYSDSWVQHAKRYTELMIERFGIGPESRVVEIASNDGYLLQHFVAKGVPVVGVEPAANIARVAVQKGIPTIVEFFGTKLARRMVEESGPADLVLGNNVLAHTPCLNDFVEGVSILLKPGGVATFEFPHLMRLMAENQFDTIYHEHFSYFSFMTVSRIFESHGLSVFDVDELPTHGGSLRVYVAHEESAGEPGPRVNHLLDRERAAGLNRMETYASFGEHVKQTKRKLLRFLIDARDRGQTVVGYGAPGKGNTLLNYCGIREDLLEYTVDRSPHKQGKFLPGTHIPIHHPDRIRQTRPDYVLILPWNLKTEIAAQLAHVEEWGGRLVVPIPEVAVLDPAGPSHGLRNGRKS